MEVADSAATRFFRASTFLASSLPWNRVGIFVRIIPQILGIALPSITQRPGAAVFFRGTLSGGLWSSPYAQRLVPPYSLMRASYLGTLPEKSYYRRVSSSDFSLAALQKACCTNSKHNAAGTAGLRPGNAGRQLQVYQSRVVKLKTSSRNGLCLHGITTRTLPNVSPPTAAGGATTLETPMSFAS